MVYQVADSLCKIIEWYLESNDEGPEFVPIQQRLQRDDGENGRHGDLVYGYKYGYGVGASSCSVAGSKYLKDGRVVWEGVILTTKQVRVRPYSDARSHSANF